MGQLVQLRFQFSPPLPHLGGLLLSVEPVPGVAGRLARLGFAPELTADDARVLYDACHGPPGS